MFCTKCGRPTEGDQILCSECAAQEQVVETAEQTPEVPAAEAPVAEVAETPVEAVEEAPAEAVEEAPAAFTFEQPAAAAPQIPSMDFGAVPNFTVDAAPEAPAPKKPKKGLIAGIVAAVLAVSIGLTTWLCWDALSWFFVSTFTSAENQLEVAQKRSAGKGSAVDIAGTVYGNALEAAQNPVDSAEMSVTLNVGDDLMSILNTAMVGSGMDLDLNWFDKVGIKVKSGAAGSENGADVVIQLNGVDLITVSMFLDMENGLLHIGIPELNDQYLYIDISEFADQIDMDMQTITALLESSAAASADLIKNLPDEKAFEKMVQKYITLAMSNLGDVDKSKEKITIDDLSQKFTALSIDVSEESLQKVAVAVLKEAEKDETLKSVIDAFLEYFVDVAGGQLGMDASMLESISADDLLEQLGDLADELEDQEMDDDELFTLINYVDNSGMICGRAVEVEGEEAFRYVKVTKGSKWEYEMVAMDTFTLTGAGTEKGGKINGEYTLSIVELSYDYDTEELSSTEHEVGTLKVIDLDKKLLTKEGNLVGTFRLEPSDELMEEAFGDASMSAIFGTAKPSLELKLTAEGAEINVLMGGKMYIGIGFTAKYNIDYKPTKPSSSVSVEGQASVMNWLKKLNPEKLFTNLEKAKVPSALVNELREAYNSAKAMLEIYG